VQISPFLTIGGQTLVSTQKVVIDNCPCFRKCLLLGRGQDVTRPCSQKPTRAWIYLHPPTGSVLDGGQGVSSILNIICARFGHGIILTNVARTRNLVWDGCCLVNLCRVILAASHWLSVPPANGESGRTCKRGTSTRCLSIPLRDFAEAVQRYRFEI